MRRPGQEDNPGDPALIEEFAAGGEPVVFLRDTTGGLRDRDYTAVIPVDAVADLDPVRHEFALERMKRVYGARLIKAHAREQEIPTAA